MGFILGGNKKKTEPKQPENQRIANTQPRRFPSNELAKPLVLAYGRQLLPGHFITGIFDHQTHPVKTEQATGGAKGGGKPKTEKTVTSYRYSGSYILAVCHGPVRALHKIYAGNDIIWSGNLLLEDTDNGVVSLSTDKGTVKLAFGTEDQAAIYANTEWPNIFHVRANRLDFGENTTPPSLRFEITVDPNSMGRGNSSGDVDAASVAYDILTNRFYGAGVDPSLINRDSFENAADILWSKGWLFSPSFDQAGSLRGILNKLVNEYCNGALIYEDGKISMVLNDNTTTEDETVAITVDDLVEEPEIETPSWTETHNETRVTFRSRERIFEEDVATYSESANQDITGQIIQKEFDRSWVTQKSVAHRIAAEIGVQSGVPPLRWKLQVKSFVEGLKAGGVINLIYPKLGINKLYLRIEELREGGPSEPGIELEGVQDFSRIKNVQPLELDAPIVFDALDVSGLPNPAEDTPLDYTDFDPEPPYFRIGALNSTMVEDELDGWMAAIARPNPMITGAALYYGSTVSGPWSIHAQIDHFPSFCKIIDYTLNGGTSITLTVVASNEWDSDLLEDLVDSIEDIYCATNRMLVTPLASPVVRHEVIPLIFKRTYGGTFQQVGQDTWEIDFDMGAYDTLQLGGSLPPGAEEYLTTNAFIGLFDNLAFARNSNINFGRSGGNYTGDSEQRRYLRVVTTTRNEAGSIEESDYVFLDRDDSTMNDDGSFGTLHPDSNPQPGDRGWWGAAVAQDYRILMLTSNALGFWRLSEASGNMLDQTLRADATVEGDILRSQTGALTGDSDEAIECNPNALNDGVIIADYGEASTTASDAQAVHFWIKVPLALFPSAGRQTLLEVNDGWGVYLLHGVVKAYRFGSLPIDVIDYDTGVSIDDGQWHHIALTWESLGANARCYIDAQLAGLSQLSPAEGENRLQMAGRKPESTAEQSFTGHLDEVAIFQKTLSWEEVLDHYNAGLGNWN